MTLEVVKKGIRKSQTEKAKTHQRRHTLGELPRCSFYKIVYVLIY